MVECIVWNIVDNCGLQFYSGIEFSKKKILQHSTQILQVMHHIDKTTLICIMFGNNLLLQNMLTLRKAGPRMLSVIL